MFAMMLLILMLISIYQSPQLQLQWPSPREGGTAAVFCLTRCPTHLIAPAAELPTPFQPNWDHNVIVDGQAFILISGQKRIKTPCLHVALSCLEQFQPNWDKSMILHMVLACCQKSPKNLGFQQCGSDMFGDNWLTCNVQWTPGTTRRLQNMISFSTIPSITSDTEWYYFVTE